MATETPTAHHWTFRIKHGRITVLVLALPTSGFTSIKSDLISALLSSGRTELSGHDIKETKAEDLELAVPVDRWDLTKGWVALEIPEEDGADSDAVDDGKKGKGKAKKVINTSPQGAGLKDGQILAFRFREDGEGWDVVVPTYDEEPSQPTEAMDQD